MNHGGRHRHSLLSALRLRLDFGDAECHDEISIIPFMRGHQAVVFIVRRRAGASRQMPIFGDIFAAIVEASDGHAPKIMARVKSCRFTPGASRARV